jgi:sugar O-acyltransferase (sialic acid O-acetyltransferase NeuD family)
VLTSRLVIAGAGDFARELLWLCSEIHSAQRAWGSICFIDDNPDEARSFMRRCGVDVPVIGAIDDFSPNDGDLLICALGNPRDKLVICENLMAKGARFTNIIHPTAAIGPGTRLGHGVIIARHSILTVDVSIGNFVTINVVSDCGHDAVVGDGCTLSSHCDVTGHAVLERGVFLGSHASVMPGVRVGELAVLGAGSVAFRNVPAGQTWLGVPAKPLFFRR